MQPTGKERDQDGMMSDQPNSEGSSRRKFLKNSATSITLSGVSISLVETAHATENGLEATESQFIETAIFHEVPEDQALGAADGIRGYSFNESRDMIGLLDSNLIRRITAADSVVSGQSGFKKAPGEVYGHSTSAVGVSEDYQRPRSRGLALAETYQQPTIDIATVMPEKVRGRVAINSGGEKEGSPDSEFSLNPGDETIISLPTQKVAVYDDVDHSSNEKGDDLNKKSIKIKPKAKIRYNGNVRIFAKEGHFVIPANPADPSVREIASIITDGEGTQPVPQSGSELIVVGGSK